MNEKVNVIPYQKIKDQKYGVCELHIEQQFFAGQQQDSKKHVIFTFSHCDFNKLIIYNKTALPFTTSWISFEYCQIKNIEIESIVDNNIILHFFSSIIAGRIEKGKIREIILMNCITPSLYLINQNSVSYYLTNDNIYPKAWKSLMTRAGINNIEELLSSKQILGIHDSKEVAISTNFDKKNKKYGIIQDNNPLGERFLTRYIVSNEQRLMLNITLGLYYEKYNEASIILKNVFFNNLSIAGRINGKLQVEDTIVNNFYLTELSSSEAVLYNISSISKESKFAVSKSNFDNFMLDNIDFTKYSVVSFYRSKVSMCYFTSCRFPNSTTSFKSFMSLKNVHYPNETEENYYKNQYEVFLQLKEALEKTGNYFEALKLKANSKEVLRKVKDVPFYDKIILCLNYWSNNHGLSIIRPLIGLIVVSMTLYFLYLYNLGLINSQENMDIKYIGYYFSFLDITHKRDFLVERHQFTNISLLIDFLNKILVGFLIYQFIASFRKYGKR